ncbi:unnamed protein product [Rotaria magnacalcarata]|uniref:Helitron helicase-like domain-containing protein n=1 Tax=Rotaria magnacalcarata TaxID=392030 RepID=A0A816Z2Y6_9BILA|nr:unnamed protein product [Rotaria magnacalcarata]
MLLYGKTINLETGSGIICKKCYKYLISNKIPPFAVNNSMWVGDVPQELQELTLSEQKLIALYRHSSCVIKLCSITRDPSLAHTALKCNVITFPQNVSEITKSLPLSSDELSQFIKIIFVGKSLPKKDQLRSILTVRREIIRKALIWLCKNNIFYKCIHIDHFLIDTLPINDIPDCLWNTLPLVDESKSQNVERSGYVTNYIDFNDLPENEIISLNTSALIDTDGGATSSIDIRQHLIRRINATNEVVASDDDNIYFIPHGRHPVNEYFNTGFLPGLYPTLFPYGMGGVENQYQQVRVTYAKHLRYFLSYHAYRFEMNTAFIFITFNILQRRTACAKVRILVSRPYFTSQSGEINQLTSAEIKLALNQIESSSYDYQSNPRLATLIKQLKTVSGSVMRSNQSRSNYRVELHSQIFFSGLPNIFITINPCDLHHPLAMKFAASHPVSIARFFNKLTSTVLSTLVGYDLNRHESHADGGVLGKIYAYYGTVEESGRGALNLHILLWLADNKHPYELRTSIKNEVASYLMGWPDHYTSHTFVNIYLIGIERYLEPSLSKLKEQINYTSSSSSVINNISLDTLQSVNKIDEVEDDQLESFELETGIDHQHLVLCNKRIDYELRPNDLSHICLYEFYSNYRKAKLTSSDKILFKSDSTSTSLTRRGRRPNDQWLFQQEHPQYSSHLLIRRSYRVVPVLLGPSIPRYEREDTKERYASAILTLFYPWRSVLDICDIHQLWSDALKIRESTFTAMSDKIITNIQLLHDCKRDRDQDLFQLVNQSLPSQTIKSSSPYNDANVDDAEEILTLLDETTNLRPNLLNHDSIESIGVHERMIDEYLKLTLANIIRSERFFHINNNTAFSDSILNNSIIPSTNVNQKNVLVFEASRQDIEQIRIWQHNLKIQKT